MNAIDYLAIGHVSRDLTPTGPRLGGSVTFAALTAQALGMRVGIVTSAPPSALLQPLRAIESAIVTATEFTTFENVYTPSGRVQTLSVRAAHLNLAAIPFAWRSAPIMHLAPIAAEVDPELAETFATAQVGVTPQGWMRQWDESGHISFQKWHSASAVLPFASAVVLSIEDVLGDEALIVELARQTQILVVTRSEQGCTLFVGGSATNIPAPVVEVVDPIGAGDIFAAAFLVRLYQIHDPLAAARFATQLASASVTRVGLEGIPDPAAVKRALAHS